MKTGIYETEVKGLLARVLHECTPPNGRSIVIYCGYLFRKDGTGSWPGAWGMTGVGCSGLGSHDLGDLILELPDVG